MHLIWVQEAEHNLFWENKDINGQLNKLDCDSLQKVICIESDHFVETFSIIDIFFCRSYRVEHRECTEVAAVDWTSVPTAPCREGLPGFDRKRSVCHEWRGVSPAVTTLWRHATCTFGYMEVRCVWNCLEILSGCAFRNTVIATLLKLLD